MHVNETNPLMISCLCKVKSRYDNMQVCGQISYDNMQVGGQILYDIMHTYGQFPLFSCYACLWPNLYEPTYVLSQTLMMLCMFGVIV